MKKHIGMNVIVMKFRNCVCAGKKGGEMKYRIHFTIKGVEDSIDIKGNTVREIIAEATELMAKRGINSTKNICWSEEMQNEQTKKG